MIDPVKPEDVIEVLTSVDTWETGFVLTKPRETDARFEVITAGLAGLVYRRMGDEGRSWRRRTPAASAVERVRALEGVAEAGRLAAQQRDPDGTAVCPLCGCATDICDEWPTACFGANFRAAYRVLDALPAPAPGGPGEKPRVYVRSGVAFCESCGTAMGDAREFPGAPERPAYADLQAASGGPGERTTCPVCGGRGVYLLDEAGVTKCPRCPAPAAAPGQTGEVERGTELCVSCGYNGGESRLLFHCCHCGVPICPAGSCAEKHQSGPSCKRCKRCKRGPCDLCLHGLCGECNVIDPGVTCPGPKAAAPPTPEPTQPAPSRQAQLFYLMCKSERGHGDTVLWWKPDSRGYTTVLDKAGKYTAEEAASKWPPLVAAIPCEEAEALAVRVVPLAGELERLFLDLSPKHHRLAQPTQPAPGDAAPCPSAGCMVPPGQHRPGHIHEHGRPPAPGDADGREKP